ncbi:MAG: putative ABC transporter permease [Coriobacteriales bacterium]|nr:putative ABC transporter permease [Coriobacteriales bacterium]
MFTTILASLLLQLMLAATFMGLRKLWRWIKARRETDPRRKLPPLSPEQKLAMRRARIKVREEYLDTLSISWYQIVIVFVVSSVIGLILEETWMYFTANRTESRVGLVWGPFSPIYGFGAVFFTLISFCLRRKDPSMSLVFLVSAVMGGLLEQVTGMGMEYILHAESWTYEYLPDCITKYVAWRFLLFWGLMGIVWYRVVMPNLLFFIGTPTTRRSIVFVGLLALYLSLDIFMTLAVFNRMVWRSEGVPAQGRFEAYLDNNYSDTWIKDRFQNLVVETAPRKTEEA